MVKTTTRFKGKLILEYDCEVKIPEYITSEEEVAEAKATFSDRLKEFIEDKLSAEAISVKVALIPIEVD